MLKERLLRLLLLPGVATPFAPLVRDRATIFFLHRFAMPDLGVRGHDIEGVRRWLAHLRRERYELVSVEEVFRRLAAGTPSFRRSVAVTIDDGYFDQARIAAPLFAEFDCPVTTFVATGFLDGQLWMWWDRLAYVFEHTRASRLELRVGDEVLPLAWSGPAERAHVSGALTERLKRVPDAAKHAAIDALAAAAEVELPAKPPAHCAPMTWDELRAAERLGMTFGPHTVTHPILSQTDDRQSLHELTTCWRRLQEEAARPSPVFCYPNGMLSDFGEREMRTLREQGLLGAVLGVAGYADRARYARGPFGPYLVHRFSYDERLSHNVQYASGLERLKEILRGDRAA